MLQHLFPIWRTYKINSEQKMKKFMATTKAAYFFSHNINITA